MNANTKLVLYFN